LYKDTNPLTMSVVGRGGEGPTHIQGNIVAAEVFICDNWHRGNNYGKLSQIVAYSI